VATIPAVTRLRYNYKPAASDFSRAIAGAAALAASAALLSSTATEEKDGGSGRRPASISDVIEGAFPAICKLEARSHGDNALGSGSGFIIDSSGLLVTNWHVFAALQSAGKKDTHMLNSGS
jgi:S1-C subfamily serine protease